MDEVRLESTGLGERLTALLESTLLVQRHRETESVLRIDRTFRDQFFEEEFRFWEVTPLQAVEGRIAMRRL